MRKVARAMAGLNPSRILITGYTGFVGPYLARECRRHYAQAHLYGLSAHPSTAAPLDDAPVVTSLDADISAAEQVRHIVAQVRPDLIFHLAALSSVAQSWSDPLGTLTTNAGGTIHLFEALRAEGLVPRVVLVGSGEQYGRVAPQDNPIREDHPQQPTNPYAISKVTQDLYGYQYFSAYGFPVVRVRAFNHFGPRQSASFVIASFCRQIALIEAGQAEPQLQVGNLAVQRDFLPVEDVVAAYLAIAGQGRAGEAYNVGAGQGRSLEAVLALLLAQSHVPIRVQIDPERFRPADVPLMVADTTRLRNDTGWHPSHDFATALANTLNYWRQVVRTEN